MVLQRNKIGKFELKVLEKLFFSKEHHEEK